MSRRQQCTAKSKRSGERCRHWAMNGSQVCHMHGGRARQVKAKAKRNLAELEASRFLQSIEVVPVENPIVELQAVAGRAKAFMTYVESRYLQSDEPAWLQLAGKAMYEFSRQCETLAKLLPAVGAPGHPETDSVLDVQIRELAERLHARSESGADRWDSAGHVLRELAWNGPDRSCWSEEDRAQAFRLLRLAVDALAVWGHPSEPAGYSEVPAPRGLPEAVEDAVVIEVPAAPRKPAERHSEPSGGSVPAWAAPAADVNAGLRRDGGW